MAKTNRFLFWTPRIILIIFALFLMLFSFDVFEGANGFWETILALFMHNLPSLILLTIIIISWKRDFIGGIIFMSLGILCFIGLVISLTTASGSRFNPILIIGSFIFLIIGLLFLMNWRQKRKQKKK